MDEMWYSMEEEAEMAYAEMIMEKGLVNIADSLLTEEDVRIKHFMLDNGIDDEYKAYLMVVEGLTGEQADERIEVENENSWEEQTKRWAEA